MTVTKSQKIEIENVLSPGRVYRVDADKYGAMKQAFLNDFSSDLAGLHSGRNPDGDPIPFA